MPQVITRKSWGSRILGALFGMIIGVILIIGSFVLTFWNEGKGLHTAQSLQQAQSVLVTVPDHPVDPKNNLRVVYVTGLATTQDVLTDPLLGVSETAIHLHRMVEMYQWQEEKETHSENNMGGSETQVTTYKYHLGWSENLINSTEFNEQEAHKNPTSMPIKSLTKYAETVTLGDFSLPKNLITQISGATVMDPAKLDITKLQAQLNKPIKVSDNVLYVGDNPADPKVGDLKITVSVVMPQIISVIAQQSNNRLQAFLAPAGETVSLVEMGQQSSQTMIQNALSQNQMMTWLLRVVSLIVMIVGFSLLLQPIVVLADVIPFFGRIVGFGAGLIAFIVGFCLWTIATAFAWFTMRPLWAVGLIVIVGGICYLIIRAKNKNIPS